CSPSIRSAVAPTRSRFRLSVSLMTVMDAGNGNGWQISGLVASCVAAGGGNGLVPAAVTDETAKAKTRLAKHRGAHVERTVAQAAAGGARGLRIGKRERREVFVDQSSTADAPRAIETLDEKAPR